MYKYIILFLIFLCTSNCEKEELVYCSKENTKVETIYISPDVEAEEVVIDLYLNLYNKRPELVGDSTYADVIIDKDKSIRVMNLLDNKEYVEALKELGW